MSLSRLPALTLSFLLLATVAQAGTAPFLNINGDVFNRKHVNPVPRPFSGMVDVTTDTTIYLEILVEDLNGPAGAVDPDSITVTLVPSGGSPIPVLQAGQVFASGFSGEVFHEIDVGENNGEAVYIVPDTPLAHNRSHRVDVFARTLDGVPIDPGADSWSFTTRPVIADPTVSWSVDLSGPVVHWDGWFFSGILKPNFNTSRLFDQLDSYLLMDTVNAVNPLSFSLQRDWPLTGDYWMNGVFDGNANPVREIETRRIIAIQNKGQNTQITVTDLPEGPLYGIAPGRPLSTDYHPGDVVTVADRHKYEIAVVDSVNDSKNQVTVARMAALPSSWVLDYPGAFPDDNPDTPDNFSLPLCYLRKLDPVGTMAYYWTRIDDEWDLVHGQHGRRLVVNPSFTPVDLALEPVPENVGGNGSISPPKDELQYHEFIREVAFHLIDRYGAATEDFYWSFGNEYNFSIFWSGTRDDFYRYYDVFVNAVLTAFEDRGLDDSRVIVGGAGEPAGLGGRGWLQDAMYHCSGMTDKPGGGIEERNWVCIDPRFAGKISSRVQAICNAWSNKGSPLDFVSIHEYELADRAVADIHLVRQDALGIDPLMYEDLLINSFEATADWIPRTDPAAAAIHLGDGYLPTWMAEWMQRLVERAESDSRYAHHESVLTVWPFDYNGQGISAWTVLMQVDEDGDGEEDYISTIRKSVFNYAELLAHMNRDLDALPAQNVEGIRIAGVRSPSPDAHLILLYSHDRFDTQSRESTEFMVNLTLSGVPWENVTVRRWRVDRDRSSPYRELLALPAKDLYTPADIVDLEAGDELEEDLPATDHAAPGGTFELSAPLVVNGVTFLEIRERDLDGDGWTDSLDNCPLLHNPAQEDGDLDTFGLACDCDDTDETVWLAPGDVAGFLVDKDGGGGTLLDWDSLASLAGPGTAYDVVDGPLNVLRAAGDFGLAACLLSGAGEPPVGDPGADPSVGDGRYFLVRGANACGEGTYGDGTPDPDPRDGLEDGAASPPAPDPCP